MARGCANLIDIWPRAHIYPVFVFPIFRAGEPSARRSLSPAYTFVCLVVPPASGCRGQRSDRKLALFIPPRTEIYMAIFAWIV